MRFLFGSVSPIATNCVADGGAHDMIPPLVCVANSTQDTDAQDMIDRRNPARESGVRPLFRLLKGDDGSRKHLT